MTAAQRQAGQSWVTAGECVCLWQGHLNALLVTSVGLSMGHRVPALSQVQGRKEEMCPGYADWRESPLRASSDPSPVCLLVQGYQMQRM